MHIHNRFLVSTFFSSNCLTSPEHKHAVEKIKVCASKVCSVPRGESPNDTRVESCLAIRYRRRQAEPLPDRQRMAFRSSPFSCSNSIASAGFVGLSPRRRAVLKTERRTFTAKFAVPGVFPPSSSPSRNRSTSNAVMLATEARLLFSESEAIKPSNALVSLDLFQSPSFP